ncbi:MAG: hypothetical protein IJA86_03580 [Clostridia bacterium]|nr:hypothetical protein [Clostridia bacterium]
MKRTCDLQLFGEQMFETEQEFSESSPVLSSETSQTKENTEDPVAMISVEYTEEIPEPSDTEKNPEKTSEDAAKQAPPFSDEIIRTIYSHIARLEEEAEELKKTFPGFDLYRELKNPVFARLTSPENGIHAADAYYAIHRKEIQAMQTEAAYAQPSVPEQQAKRPQENGISAKAPTVMQFDYRNASRERREALKKAIRTAAAKGEKIYPG